MTAPILLLVLAVLGASAADAAEARRIVAAGPAVTETIYALGAGDRLVATDTSSVYPAAAQALPKVGYMRQLGAEGVLSMRPDLLLASADAGPAVALDQLRATGLTVATLPERYDAAAVAARVRAVGVALDETARAEPIAAALDADFAALAAIVRALPEPAPRVVFVLGMGGGTSLQASGRDTGAAAILALAGATNAVDGYSGYRALSAEAAAAAAPEWIVMMSQTVEAAGGVDAVLAMPQLALTPAAQARRLIAMDASYLLGWGPRTAHAARDLAAAIRPGQTVATLPPRPWVK